MGRVSHKNLVISIRWIQNFVQVQDVLLKIRFQKLCSLKKSEETMIYLVSTPKPDHQHSGGTVSWTLVGCTES